MVYYMSMKILTRLVVLMGISTGIVVVRLAEPEVAIYVAVLIAALLTHPTAKYMEENL